MAHIQFVEIDKQFKTTEALFRAVSRVCPLLDPESLLAIKILTKKTPLASQCLILAHNNRTIISFDCSIAYNKEIVREIGHLS